MHPLLKVMTYMCMYSHVHESMKTFVAILHINHDADLAAQTRYDVLHVVCPSQWHYVRGHQTSDSTSFTCTCMPSKSFQQHKQHWDCTA